MFPNLGAHNLCWQWSKFLSITFIITATLFWLLANSAPMVHARLSYNRTESWFNSSTHLQEKEEITVGYLRMFYRPINYDCTDINRHFIRELGPFIVQKLLNRSCNCEVNVITSSHTVADVPHFLSLGVSLNEALNGDMLWGVSVLPIEADSLTDQQLPRINHLTVLALDSPSSSRNLANIANISLHDPHIYGSPALLLTQLFPELVVDHSSGHVNKRRKHVLLVRDSVRDGSFDESECKFLHSHTASAVSATWLDSSFYDVLAVEIPKHTEERDKSNVMSIIAAMTQSSVVITSSLPVAIVAESLRVPARLIRKHKDEPLEEEIRDYYQMTQRDFSIDSISDLARMKTYNNSRVIPMRNRSSLALPLIEAFFRAIPEMINRGILKLPPKCECTLDNFNVGNAHMGKRAVAHVANQHHRHSNHLLTDARQVRCPHFTQYSSQSLLKRSSTTLRTAVIFSSLPYHYEIVAFTACTLKKLGHVVHLWIFRDPLYEDAFAHCADAIFDAQIYNSYDFSIDSENRNCPQNLQHKMRELYVDSNRYDIRLLAYMTAREDTTYAQAYGIHDMLRSVAAHTVMFIHDANEVFTFSEQCRRPLCTITCLADHVTQQARDYLEISVSSDHNASLFDVQTIVPSFHLPASPLLTTPRHKIRNVTTIVIQGKVEPIRRKYSLLFQCLRKVDASKSIRPIVLKIVGVYADSLRVTPQEFMKGPHKHIKLDENTLRSFRELQKYNFVRIETYDNVAYSTYYKEITSSDFLVTFINMESGKSYLVDKASSSVETALISNVPIVLPPSILRQYSCWKSSPMHRKVSKRDDCKSLEAALQLTDAELDAWRAEATFCKQYYLEQAMGTIDRIINSTKQS